MNSGYNNSDRYSDNEPAVEYDPSPDELVSLARDIRNGVAPDFDDAVASRLEAIASAFWECIRMNGEVNQRYRALLSQPTPTAEPVSPRCLFGHDALTSGGQCRRCGVQVVEEQPIAAEPSMCGNTLRTENYVHECVEDAGHTGKHMSVTGIWWTHDTTHPEPPRIEDMAPENPEGWPYSTDPANAKRCGEAYVGYEGGEGSCEYLPNHSGRHWSARWGSWSL